MLYIIGLHWAALGFLAVAPLFCVVRWSRGMDVRCPSVFYCLFFGGGVSMDYGGVVSVEHEVKVMSLKATPKSRVFQFTFPLCQRGSHKTLPSQP